MKRVNKIGGAFFDFIETIVIALSIFLVVYLFFMQPHQVYGQSMVPNFLDGEYVLTDKVAYKMRDPERGEVVVFQAPEAANCYKGTGCDFIKRILALPGETIEVKNNGIYIDGVKLAEAYIPTNYQTLPGEFTKNRSITLGENEYFVVGDNRPYSSDSRVWGPISKENILGRAFYRYWPLKTIGKIVKAEY